jgi:hypothetical protein
MPGAVRRNEPCAFRRDLTFSFPGDSLFAFNRALDRRRESCIQSCKGSSSHGIVVGSPPQRSATTMRVSLLFFSAVVVVLSVQGQSNNFTGPGYLSCDYVEWDQSGGCAYFGVDRQCPTLSSCTLNSSDILPPIDATGTIIYISLFCDCFSAFDCPASCTKSEGSPPELPTVTASLNFTGVGTVTCPFVDFYTLQGQSAGQCLPGVLNRDFSACGSCSIGDLRPTTQAGDEFISFPLLCDCVALFGCPDSCIFEAGLAIGSNTTQSPSPAPTPRNDTAVTEPPASGSRNTTSAPTVSPVAANITVPTANVSKPVAAPIRSPAGPNNTTSAAAPVWRWNCRIVAMVLWGWMSFSGYLVL